MTGRRACRRRTRRHPGHSYLLEILARCSVGGLGGVIQIQIALDGFPQVMLGITAEAAMLPPPVMIPVGGMHHAQAAQRRRKIPGQILSLSLR